MTRTVTAVLAMKTIKSCKNSKTFGPDTPRLPLVKCPGILGVYLDPSLSFNKHDNIIKALTGTSCGQQKETLLMTYKAVKDRLSTTLHLFGIQTYTAPTTDKYNIHRTRL